MMCGETRPRIVISNTAHDGDDVEQEDQELVLFFRGNAAERRSHGARVTSFDSGGIAARAFIEPRNRREIFQSKQTRRRHMVACKGKHNIESTYLGMLVWFPL